MAIELVDLTKKFQNIMAVDHVNMTFEDSTLNVLIGPSGCGKTTTMKMINRLVERSGGDIRFDGTSIDDVNSIELRRSIGYVIQEIGLLPHLTVYDNVAIVPRLLKWQEGKIKPRVKELLDLVNMEPAEFMGKYPSQLSGGQRQRVGVARGLAADPKILLMDEPFGAIDPITREKLQDRFLEIQSEIQKTIIFVTHDIREAVKLGDRIAVMRKGVLVQYDETIKVVHNPENEFVEDLLGSDRALKGLELLRVKDNYDTKYFSLDVSQVNDPAAALKLLTENHRNFGYVVNEKNVLLGYVLARDLERAKGDTVRDHIRRCESTGQFSTLMEAVTLMVSTGLTAVPVTDDSDRILGMLRFREIFEKVEEMAASFQDE